MVKYHCQRVSYTKSAVKEKETANTRRQDAAFG